jgi:hypothetical protein
MTQFSETGNQVQLTESGSDRYVLCTPIMLDVRRDEHGHYVVSEDQFNLYGVGDSLSEAVEDYQAMLIEHYEDLSRSEAPLSGYLQKQLEILGEHRKPTSVG